MKSATTSFTRRSKFGHRTLCPNAEFHSVGEMLQSRPGSVFELRFVSCPNLVLEEFPSVGLGLEIKEHQELHCMDDEI